MALQMRIDPGLLAQVLFRNRANRSELMPILTAIPDGKPLLENQDRENKTE
jgi:hypothetical protein